MEMESYSEIIDPAREQSIPLFHRDEMVLGDMLGSGGFNNVFQLYKVDLLNAELTDNDSDSDRSSLSPRLERNQQEIRRAFLEGATRSCYAIKMLQPEVMHHKEDYCNGAADLIVETKILSNLGHHPNIIRLHGASEAGVSGFAQGVEGGYFIVLDRLATTLDRRLEEWQRKQNAPKLIDRVRILSSLADALKHVHASNIIFRDLKPDNVGFDTNGVLKLFDFGLAKELNPNEQNTEETYEMSGKTGSRRYMAPEVALSEPYHLSADIYSFGILMWQMCAIEEPYSGMTKESHMETVVNGHERPEIKTEWPCKLGNMMKWSWDSDLHLRPSMKDLHRALKRQIRMLAVPDSPSLSAIDAINFARQTNESNNASSASPYMKISHQINKRTPSNFLKTSTKSSNSQSLTNLRGIFKKSHWLDSASNNSKLRHALDGASKII